MDIAFVNNNANFFNDKNKPRERRGRIGKVEEVRKKREIKGEQLAQSGASQTTVQTVPNHTNSVNRRMKSEENQQLFTKPKYRTEENSSESTGDERVDFSKERDLFKKFFIKYKQNKYQNIGMADLDKYKNYFPYCEEQNLEQTPHRKKKNEDKQFCYKSKRKDELLNQRKSKRIKKQIEQDNLDVQVMEMAVYFNQGHFRYNCKEAELKLSYLESNNGGSQFYSVGRNLGLPGEPSFSSLGEDAVRNILVERARSLMARVIHGQKLV